jgi:hypothetical protein
VCEIFFIVLSEGDDEDEDETLTLSVPLVLM